MGAEILLYGYGLVCLSMLVFNLLYSLHLRSGDRRLTLRTDALRRQVTEQLRQIVRPGDLVLTVGAGDIYRVGEKLLKEE